MTTYTSALNEAEANVDRLSRAMEAAEEEMENTFKRTTELHRSTAERREQEVLELRKVLAAKERSIDSLRETLSTTKRNLETRSIQAETTLAAREADVHRLLAEVKKVKQESATVKGELSALKGAKHSLETQVEHEVSSNRKQIENMARTEMLLKEREQEHSLGLRRYTAEHNQMKSQLQMERQKRELVVEEATELHHQLTIAVDKLKIEGDSKRDLQHKLEAERKKRKDLTKQKSEWKHSRETDVETRLRIVDLEKKLHEERASRVGAEKWLQSELKSKDEMEGLFCSLRDVAIRREKDTELGELKQAVAELQKQRDHLQRESFVHHQNREFDVLRTSLERENDRLRVDLTQARKDISTRLYAPPLLNRDPDGDMLARCRRCHDRFSLSKPPDAQCGFHPGDLTPNGYTCCGVVPRQGASPVYCHWRPHVA